VISIFQHYFVSLQNTAITRRFSKSTTSHLPSLTPSKQIIAAISIETLLLKMYARNKYLNKAMVNLTASATKINHLLALEKITVKDIEDLNHVERQYLAETATQTLTQLKDVERDNFLDKIDQIVPASTKSDIWEYNHSLISSAVSNYMRKNGVMPAKSDIARETGLSRQTVAKHFCAYKRHPEYTSTMEQFKFMAPNVLANVFKHALNGDMKAARLYFEMVGATKKQPAGTVINEQNNYIQINNTILSQENLKQLSEEQLNRIENIITNNGSIEIS
jgi:hypothetical protein